MAIVLIAVAVVMHYNYTQNRQQFVSFRFSEQMTLTTQTLPEFLVWIALTGFFFCAFREIYFRNTRGPVLFNFFIREITVGITQGRWILTLHVSLTTNI